MRTLLAVLLLTSGLAGCITGANDPDPPTSPPERNDATLNFAEPRHVARLSHPNAQGSESFTAVSPDGQTILTCQWGAGRETIPLLASTDAGATFTRLTPPPEAGVGGDCDVALGADGTWYFLSMTPAATTIFATHDEGSTWTIGRPVTTAPMDRPWLTAHGDDTLFLSYMPLSSLPPRQPGGVGFVRSDDGGATWSSPLVIAPPDGSRYTTVMAGRVMVADDGDTVQIPFYKLPNAACLFPCGPALLSLATSHDGGQTFHVDDVLGPIEGIRTFPAAARVGEDIHWPFAVQGPELSGTFLLHSGDGGATWSSPHEITSVPGELTLAIDGRRDGTATLALQAQGRAADPGLGDAPYLLAFRLDPRGPDALRVQAAVITPNERQEFVGLDHDAQGRAYLTFTDESDQFVALETVQEQRGAVGPIRSLEEVAP